jgi:hypothetical protein
MTEEKTTDASANPALVSLDERSKALVSTLEELLEHARHGRVISMGVFAEMPHPMEPLARHLVVIYNAPEDDKEFVTQMSCAVMEIGAKRRGAIPYEQGKYAH